MERRDGSAVLLIVFLVCSLFFLLPAKAAATGFLHRSGTQVLDSDNNSVKLCGMGWGGGSNAMDWWGNLADIKLSDIQTIKDNGGDITELNGFRWATMEPSQGNYNSMWLSNLDTIVSWAQNVGVYVILVPYYGNGATPSWAAVSDWQTDEAGFFNLSNHNYDNMRNAYASYMVMLVQRYKNDPYFLLDFYNEPFNGNSQVSSSDPAVSADYAATITWLITQVVNAGYQNPVFVDEPWCNGGLGSPVSVGTGVNMIWECHDYMGDNGQTYSEWQSQINWDVDRYVTGLGYPVWIGEWGDLTSYGNADDSASNWQTNSNNMVAYMNSIAGIVGHDWWCYGSLDGSAYSSTGYGWQQPPSGSCFTFSESAWLLANAMVGATIPSLTPPSKPSPMPSPTPTPTPTLSPTATPNPTSTPTLSPSPTDAQTAMSTPTSTPNTVQTGATTQTFTTTSIPKTTPTANRNPIQRPPDIRHIFSRMADLKHHHSFLLRRII